MARLRRRHGPPRLVPEPPFRSLLEAIVSQQISGRAAASIVARLEARLALEPASLARAHLLRLRGAGLSRTKALAVRALAQFAESGGLDQLDRLGDAAIIERLTTIRGIGEWTAQMFLIFSLNRPDVWPVGDGGIQRAARRLYGILSPRRLPALGERFRPWRSHAAWYLWRALDE